MNNFKKIAVGALMLAGATLGVAVPANAGVAVGVTIGTPGVAVRVGNPCFREYRFRPAYCGYPVYGQPLFVGGVAYRQPVYVRTVGGQRYFWLHNGWQRDRVEFHRVIR
jgi:hypothetical protein